MIGEVELRIIGLPNVGKNTLFNAITNAGAQSINCPFYTIEPNAGVIAVPDKRLDKLVEVYHPEKYTLATIEFVDIAGLVRGASKGKGLGSQFLVSIRGVGVVVHVTRCFEDDDIIHVDDNIDPARDMETINLELILSDMKVLDCQLNKTRKMLRADKKYQAECEFFERVRTELDASHTARSVEYAEEEAELLVAVSLLTNKLVICAAGMSDADFRGGVENNPYSAVIEKLARQRNADVLPICAGVEAEVSGMEPEEKQTFLEDMGLSESDLDRLIREYYALLGLISYLTADPQEVCVWMVKGRTKAPQAADRIHTDFEHGFIRAEVVAYDDLMTCDAMAAAKEKGLTRSEGKEYVMKDGDVVLFHFNV